MKKNIFRIIAIALTLTALFALYSCGTEKTTVNVSVLKGPTGMGAVKLIEDTTDNAYNFSIDGAPDVVQSLLLSGEADIAAVPTNLAAALYNKTNGEIKVAAVNTLGVLYILENGDTIHSVEDLRGKTLYATGQASTPEYILNYVLEKNGLVPGVDVKIEYKTEHSELASLLSAGSVEIGMLPEPNVTAARSSNPNLRIALDITREWENVCGEGNLPVQGCIVVRSEFAEKNKAALDKFLDEYKKSVEYVNGNAADASVLVEKHGIMAKAALAEKAIPNCNICYKDGKEMKKLMNDFLAVLFEANAKSIGGKMPDDSFYYEK